MVDPIKLMMDYTLFHIGTYITLSTLLMTFLALESVKKRFAVARPFLITTLICFMIAGVCGGVIAATLPHLKTGDSLRETKTGPFFARQVLSIEYWTIAEHGAFWIGAIIAAAGVIVLTRQQTFAKPGPSETALQARALATQCYEASTRVESAKGAEIRKMANAISEMAEDAEMRV